MTEGHVRSLIHDDDDDEDDDTKNKEGDQIKVYRLTYLGLNFTL